MEHHVPFLELLTVGTVSQGGLQARLASIRSDFTNETAKLEMQVIGLFGKLLTGLGHGCKSSIHQQKNKLTKLMASMLRNVVSELKDCSGNSISLLTRDTNFFGNKQDGEDSLLKQLRQRPSDKSLVGEFFTACLTYNIAVLERQYKQYFETDLTAELKKGPTTLT